MRWKAIQQTLLLRSFLHLRLPPPSLFLDLNYQLIAMHPYRSTESPAMKSHNTLPLSFSVRPLRALVPALAMLVAGLTATGAVHAADEAAQMELGKQLFMVGAQPACAICHTLKDAGSEGAVGPVLDELQPDAARVTKALRDGLGAMPSFKETLSEEQIAALALYVSKASRLP